ncbi:MAG: triphosphoribosyl-dephospho-CoA synthase [Burkholderiales bacterium]|nr:triphosphoribosyl-dephospho-CoA synthase [Burkholderiales bacterium]
MTLSPTVVARAFVDACLLDMSALKPGNVGFHGAGHGMSVAQFIASARAAAPALAAPRSSVGQRILGAIEATQAAVGTNTNLGIVLLAAPLAHAALSPGGNLAETLAALTVDDAEQTFAAIRLARPGGLGHSDRHDVHAPAQVTLLEAMREAAPRDFIAAQYAGGYADVLGTGHAALAAGRMRGLDWRQSTTEVFLAFLSRYPDSHVLRKLGPGCAVALREEAARVVCDASSSRAFQARLCSWDGNLKARGINPGTSADLTVATLFAGLLGDASG